MCEYFSLQYNTLFLQIAVNLSQLVLANGVSAFPRFITTDPQNPTIVSENSAAAFYRLACLCKRRTTFVNFLLKYHDRHFRIYIWVKSHILCVIRVHLLRACAKRIRNTGIRSSHVIEVLRVLFASGQVSRRMCLCLCHSRLAHAIWPTRNDGIHSARLLIARDHTMSQRGWAKISDLFRAVYNTYYEYIHVMHVSAMRAIAIPYIEYDRISYIPRKWANARVHFGIYAKCCTYV